jgi:hypothetical protein
MDRIRSQRHLEFTARASVVRSSCLGITVLFLSLAASSHAQECPPPGATCPRNGTPVAVDFESFAAGTSVEGLGAVYPDLAITTFAGASPACTVGSAQVIEAGNPTPGAYGTASGSNDCLTGTKGFGDVGGCALDYRFTFSPGTTVSCFSIHMLDFGDFFPYGGTTHNVTLQAFAGTTLVDTDALLVSGGVQLVGGDACTAAPGDPGNHVFRVTGAGITRVLLTFDESPDPNVGFDDLQFCKDGEAVAVSRLAWSRVKSVYRLP